MVLDEKSPRGGQREGTAHREGGVVSVKGLHTGRGGVVSVKELHTGRCGQREGTAHRAGWSA